MNIFGGMRMSRRIAAQPLDFAPTMACSAAVSAIRHYKKFLRAGEQHLVKPGEIAGLIVLGA